MTGIAFLLMLLATVTAEEYRCLSRKPCVLHDVTLVTEKELSEVVFPDITDPLTIASGRIPNLTRKLAEKMSNIVDLTVNNLHMETIYIRPDMTHVEATDNLIHTILVDNDTTHNYELMSLNLTNNKLSNVASLVRFTKLRALTLDGCELERLSMDTFAQMTELRDLSIARNALQVVDTQTSFNLMKLRSLSLAGNQLMELDVEKWDNPSLVELDLTSNRLYMLNGGFGRFKGLEQAKISGNYWKCEVLVEINRLPGVVYDSDEKDRCVNNSMGDVKNICCTVDASNFLNTGDGDELFGEKWTELRKLRVDVTKLNESFVQGKEEAEKKAREQESALQDRIEKLEEQVKNVLEKFDAKEESVAVEETNQLREVVSDHKGSIKRLEEKLSGLSDNLDGFVDSLNELRESIDERFSKVSDVPEKIADLEKILEDNDSMDSITKNVTRLDHSLRSLEGQQLKYHLSSVDLKSQINVERSRINEVQHQYGKLTREYETLRDQLNQAQENLSLAFKIIDEISTSDE